MKIRRMLLVIATLVMPLTFPLSAFADGPEPNSSENGARVWNYGMCVAHYPYYHETHGAGPWTHVENRNDDKVMLPNPPAFPDYRNCGVWWWH